MNPVFPASHGADPLLSVQQIEVIYDGAILGVADVSLQLARGEVVALLGANGAGKSSTFKAISGLVQADRARVSRGEVRLRGQRVDGLAPNWLARQGLVHVLEGRHVFSHLTVEENLLCGALARRLGRAATAQALERIYSWLPRLKTKRRTLAGLGSGGEQQMLAIGRALLTEPELVLLDEPSMGLAPILVQEVFDIVTRLNREAGVSFLIAEQNLHVALRHAQRAYVLESGRVALEGPAADLLARDDLHELYLGGALAAA